MILEQKTLEKLRDLINEETQYRKGYEIVAFFNELGFNDTYGQGFPSRWVYTDDKLKSINGTPEIDKCIKKLFAPVNYIGRFKELDNFISDFNQYLAFDNWKVVRAGKEIKFAKASEIDFSDSEVKGEIKEDEFLNLDFKDVKLESVGLDRTITEVLNLRIDEIKKCLISKAPLSVIFMCGSTLEGILLGVALKNPRQFNSANSSPKDKEGKVKQLHSWTLSNFINTAYEIGLIKEDVKKFSHSLRDFRNYIHPYEQLSSRFNPDYHTAKISWQVLKAAINQLIKNKL
jgi:hypothetical protein